MRVTNESTDGINEKRSFSGHPVRELYTHEDLDGFDPERELGLPGGISFHARRSPEHVSRTPLDHAVVCRFRHIRGHQQTIQIPSETGADGIVCCVRSYATLGEMCDTLRSIFGEYHEPDFS
jgi:hypothetical protein